MGQLTTLWREVVAILVLNTLIVFACFELAARGVFLAARGVSKIASVMAKPTEQLVGEGHPREKVSYYASEDWAGGLVNKCVNGIRRQPPGG
jgi:hypothetical protein